MDLQRLILVVVGAHPLAELEDRPTADHLRRRLDEALATGPGASGARALVLTDVWYLSHDELRSLPTLAVGGPERNAATAWLRERVPDVYVVDDVLAVQMDPSGEEPVAACWGVTAEATATAAGLFIDRYLAEFVRRAGAALA